MRLSRTIFSLTPFILVSAVAAAISVRAQDAASSATQQAPPNPCESDERHHKLDFWIGEWDVYVNDALAGHNVIESVAGGCALTESWVNVRGIPGVSLNYFDNKDGKYKQIWVASGNHTLFVEEHAEPGKLVMIARSTNAEGVETQTRLTFTKQGENVRQLFENSTDGGETWTAGFDGVYVPSDEP